MRYVRSILSVFIVFVVITTAITPTMAAQVEVIPVARAPYRPSYENEFFDELNVQADLYYEDFIKNRTDISPTVWQTAKRISILKLRQMGQVKSWINVYGGSAMRNAIAIEVLSNWVVTPVLGLLHLPGLALVTAAVPWGVIVGAIQTGWNLNKRGLALRTELEISSLKDLKQLHDNVVGYDIKNHISTLVYQSAKPEFEKAVGVEIVKKLKQSDGLSEAPLLTVAQLEDLVRLQGPEGVSFLKDIYVSKADSAVYTSRLINFVSKQPDLLRKMNVLIEQQLRALASSTPNSSARKTLMALHDLRQSILNSAVDLRGQLDAIEKERGGFLGFFKKEEPLSILPTTEPTEEQVSALMALEFNVERLTYYFLYNLKSKLSDPQAMKDLSETTERFATERLGHRFKEIRFDHLSPKSCLYLFK